MAYSKRFERELNKARSSVTELAKGQDISVDVIEAIAIIKAAHGMLFWQLLEQEQEIQVDLENDLNEAQHSLLARVLRENH